MNPTIGEDRERMDEPAILLAILIAGRKIGDEMLRDAADAALASQGICVSFRDTTTPTATQSAKVPA